MVWYSIEFLRGIVLKEKDIFELLKKHLNEDNKIHMNLIFDIIKECFNCNDSDEKEQNIIKEPKYTINVNYENEKFNIMKLEGYAMEDVLNLCVLQKSDFTGEQRKKKIGFFRMGHCCDKNQEIILGYHVNEISLGGMSKKSTKIGVMMDKKKDKTLEKMCEKLRLKYNKTDTYVQTSDCLYCT